MPYLSRLACQIHFPGHTVQCCRRRTVSKTARVAWARPPPAHRRRHFQTRLAGLGFAHGAIVPDGDFMVMRNWDAPFASPHLAERPVTG